MKTHMNLFSYDNLMIWACVGLSLCLSLYLSISLFFNLLLSIYVCARLSANLLLVAP